MIIKRKVTCTYLPCTRLVPDLFFEDPTKGTKFLSSINWIPCPHPKARKYFWFSEFKLWWDWNIFWNVDWGMIFSIIWLTVTSFYGLSRMCFMGIYLITMVIEVFFILWKKERYSFFNAICNTMQILNTTN